MLGPGTRSFSYWRRVRAEELLVILVAGAGRRSGHRRKEGRRSRRGVEKSFCWVLLIVEGLLRGGGGRAREVVLRW